MIISENTQIEGSLEIWTSATITSGGIVSANTFRDYNYSGGFALASNLDKDIVESNVTSAQIEYLNTTSANIQTQLSNLSATKQNVLNGTTDSIPKFSGSGILSDSLLSEVGSNIEQASGFFRVRNLSATQNALVFTVSGDNASRFVVDMAGTINWGPGGGTARDVNLYRGGTNILRTDDTFIAPSLSATTITVGSIDNTEFSYLNNVSANIQTQLSNLSATKASSSVTITAGTMLSGGGDLTTDRTISHQTVGTSGTYSNFVTNSTGHITSARALISADIPTLPTTKIGSGIINDTEFNYLDTVSANIQTQLTNLSGSDSIINSQFNSYLPLSGGTMTGNISAIVISATNFYDTSFVGSKVLVSDTDKEIIESSILTTELSHLANVSANIQSQINQLSQQAVSGNGAGTVNRITKFVTSSSMGDSSITDNGTLVTFTTQVSANNTITAPNFTGLASRATSALNADTLKTSRTFSLSGEVTSTNVPSFNGSGNIVLSAVLANGINATKIANGSVTSTEFQYINSLSANAQTQLINLSGTKANSSVTIITTSGLTGGGDLTTNRTIGLLAVGTSGTYNNIVTNNYGQVTSARNLISADIPTLPPSKILEDSNDRFVSDTQISEWNTAYLRTSASKIAQGIFDAADNIPLSARNSKGVNFGRTFQAVDSPNQSDYFAYIQMPEAINSDKHAIIAVSTTNANEMYFGSSIWNEAPTWRRIWHSNDFSQTDINNWNTSYTSAHTHSNKSTLDLINQSLNTSATISADKIILTNNNNGTNVRIGDDAWLGDINVGNTISIRGVQSSTQGYIRFGADAQSLGYDGSKLLYTGTFTSNGITNFGTFRNVGLSGFALFDSSTNNMYSYINTTSTKQFAYTNNGSSNAQFGSINYDDILGLSANYVTLNTQQSITGLKSFTNSLVLCAGSNTAPTSFNGSTIRHSEGSGNASLVYSVGQISSPNNFHNFNVRQGSTETTIFQINNSYILSYKPIQATSGVEIQSILSFSNSSGLITTTATIPDNISMVSVSALSDITRINMPANPSEGQILIINCIGYGSTGHNLFANNNTNQILARAYDGTAIVVTNSPATPIKLTYGSYKFCYSNGFWLAASPCHQ